MRSSSFHTAIWNSVPCAASGTVNFLPPDSIRADNFTYRDARLPYAKFPRNPAL